MLDHEATIATESQRFLDAVRSATPDAPVPTCPEWTVADLAWHLTEVHAFWARILESGAQTDEESEAVEGAKPGRPDTHEATLDLFEAETANLLTELIGRDDDEPAWFWLDTSKTVGATRRMQAHEATMHRVDAELAAGLESAPIDAALAAEGAAHAFEVMWAWWGTLPGFAFTTPTGGPVELAASDTGDRWVAQPGRWQGVGESGKNYDVPGARLVTDRAPVASVTGTAEALMRWLWGRGERPEASGDGDALAALDEARDQGIQ